LNNPRERPSIRQHDDDADDSLIERCKAGDRDAFRQVFERYQRRAYALAFGIVRNRDEALDVVQEGFLKAFRSLAGFAGNASIYTWLYRIIMNVAIDHKRKEAREQKVDYDDTIAHMEEEAPAGSAQLLPQLLRGDPAKETSRREIREKIDEALAKLSDNHRAVLVMREIDGLSYEEMAKVMKCSKGTIMSRLFHARRNMQKHLIDTLGPDADEVES
jgi:RNA polymerase sigma-70 factor (ECF subfamily)